MEYVDAGGLRIARPLYEFVNTEAIPGTGVKADTFWQGFAGLMRDLAPRNKALLDQRDAMQRQIDAWHLGNRGKPIDTGDYLEFLRGIGYLQPEPADFVDRHRQRRCRDRQHRRPAACRAGDQCALCAERGECALGQPVRRAVWHRCDSRGWRRDARFAATTRCAAHAWWRRRARCWIRPCRLPAAAMRMLSGYAARWRPLCSRLCGNGSRTGLARPVQFVGYRGDWR